MALSAGQRLGPYEIVGPLGAGGMGEVYKARDTRLERTVAIKVLPATLAGDPEFKARFEREAKSISALNHPNICTLHDVGETDGAAFLVMELLEGETLADRLKKGPIPVDQALDLASQIADALDKAHRQGIVHRDLKPANVFLLRAAGASAAPHCKLLDFGLAKMGAAAPPGSIETRLLTTPSPAQTAPLTSQGSILGTFQYMAPEQVEGGEADARTDIWGFGCVLYEMVTGRRAFEGKSQASLIASILERQPAPIAEFQPLTPPALARVVRTCLEKNPDNRFHTAHDLWLHLQWIEEGGSAAGLPAPVVAGRKRQNALVFGGAALVLAALAAAGAWALKPAPPPAKDVVVRFPYSFPDGIAYTRGGRRFLAISPDGTRIAFIANQRIYLRNLNELEALPIRGSDLDPLDLVFSPDGQSIAFFQVATNSTGGTLRRIDVVGGKAVAVCEIPTAPFGVHWQGDRIVYSMGNTIFAVTATGGTPQALVSVAKGTPERLAHPQIVGDGGALVYTVRTTAADSRVVVQSPIEGGTPRILVDGGTDGRVLPTGHLVWARDNSLYAQALDTDRWQLTGGPVPIVEGIRMAGATGGAQIAISANGTLAFAPGAGAQVSDLVWVDRTGHAEPTGAPPQTFTYPRVSPDGTRIVASTTDLDSDIWLWDVVHKTSTKLTSGPGIDSYPLWTADSKFILFRSGTAGTAEIDLFRRAVDGTGDTPRISAAPLVDTPMSILKDGRVLLRRTPSDTSPEGTLELMSVEPGAKPAPLFAKQPAPIVNAEVSPDGRWLAYQSGEGSTGNEIHVRPFPDVEGGHWQISSGVASRPMWSKSDRNLELFYHAVLPGGANKLMRVAVPPLPAGAPFKYSTPEPVLDLAGYSFGALGRAWDIAADGKRFLLIRAVGADAVERNSMIVVTHWFDELKARFKTVR